VWILTTAEFNRIHYEKLQFKEREPGSIWNFVNFVDFADFMEAIILKPLVALLKSCGLCHTSGEKYIRRKSAAKNFRVAILWRELLFYMKQFMNCIGKSRMECY
jgi:hypothetical protein